MEGGEDCSLFKNNEGRETQDAVDDVLKDADLTTSLPKDLIFLY